MTKSDEKIIKHIDALDKQVAKQTSFARMFFVGVVYGVGFFIGSAIIATIVIGLFGPWFAEIPWVRDSFEAGVQLLQTKQ